MPLIALGVARRYCTLALSLSLVRQAAVAVLLIISGICATHADGIKTVAVWDFDNATMPGTALKSVDSLRRVLPEALLATLGSAPALKIVERVNLREVLQEQKLGTSDLVDEQSRLRLGKIAGAHNMIFGTYMVIGDQIRVDVRTVEVETSLIKSSESITGNEEEVLRSMDKVAQQIIRKIGGSAPTSSAARGSMDVWNLYDQGILLMDAAKYKEAIEVFKRVLKQQADFKPAEKQIALALERIARQ